MPNIIIYIQYPKCMGYLVTTESMQDVVPHMHQLNRQATAGQVDMHYAYLAGVILHMRSSGFGWGTFEELFT